MIPIVITARKQSQRCHNKLLRDFTKDGRSLLDVCLEKFHGNSNVYIAGYEKDFSDLAQKHQVSFIQRTEESALSEDPMIIHSYLKPYSFEHVCLLNPCCPMVKAQTVFDALEVLELNQFPSLFSVKKTNDIVFDSNFQLVNTDRVFNSKIRKPNYIGNNVLVVFKPVFFFDKGTYWTYTQNDPYLYEMDHSESVDIDTELDFKIAQTIYQSLYQKHS